MLGPVIIRPLRSIALIAALTVLGAACSSGTATTSTTTTTFVTPATVPPTTATTAVIPLPTIAGNLTVWADPALADAVRSRAVLFTADTGVTVTVVPMSRDEILASLLAGDEPGPDVFIGPHTWLFQLAVAGLTEPVHLGADLPQGAVDAVSLRTYPLAVPLAVDALVQVRNPGIEGTRPEAIESFDCSGCLVLPADGDFDVTYPLLASLGGYVFGPDEADGYDTRTTGVDTEQAIAAATTLESLVAAGAVSTSADRAAVLARFAAGDAGVIWAGPEAIGVLPGEVVEPLPTVGDAAAISSVKVLAAYVNATGSLKPAAREFAEQYLGDQDGSRAFADASGLAPMWGAVASSAELMVIESANGGQPVPYAPETSYAWSEMSAAFAGILAGQSAETALRDAGDNIRFAETSTTTIPG